MPDLVEVPVEIHHETERAWLVDIDGKEVWLPKSIVQIEDGTATMPEWLAMEKRLV